jgi:hypothetical protein
MNFLNAPGGRMMPFMSKTKLDRRMMVQAMGTFAAGSGRRRLAPTTARHTSYRSGTSTCALDRVETARSVVGTSRRVLGWP